MRRTPFFLAVLSALAFLVSFAFAPPAQGGDNGPPPGGVAVLEITKVVEGDGPTGGYVIEFSCTDIFGKGGGGSYGGSLAFDAAGPGAPETQTVDVTGPGTCTVEETDANGADTVTYACEFESGPIAASPGDDDAFAEAEGFPQGCEGDRSASYASLYDVATITVTNTFDAEVIDDDDEQDADVVTATPTFTG